MSKRLVFLGSGLILAVLASTTGFLGIRAVGAKRRVAWN